jgi:hemoglobin
MLNSKPAIATAALATALVFVGCAMQPAPPQRAQSLYQRLGGNDVITAVVNETVGNITADVRINQRFAHVGGPKLTRNLVDLICERTGGPCTYTGRNMADAHDGMNIRDEEFHALVDDLAKALDKCRVRPRERGEVLAIVGQMKNAVVGH